MRIGKTASRLKYHIERRKTEAGTLNRGEYTSRFSLSNDEHHTTIRSAAVNGVISLEKALKIAAKIDEERNGTQELLQECEKHVGMLLGEKINVHVAAMNGTTFNLVEYHYEKPVGEQ